MATPVGDSYAVASGGVIAAGRVVVSQYWRDRPAGWSEIALTGTKPWHGIIAYSGFGVDSLGGKLYQFGGGHADYWGNEVWQFDLEALAWTQLYTPDSGANPDPATVTPYLDNTTWPGAWLFDGGATKRPISRHTYQSVHWASHLNRLVTCGASTYSGTLGEQMWAIWPNSPKDMWYFDPATLTWEYINSTLKDAAFDVGAHRMAYDRIGQKMYSVFKDASSRLRLHIYNFATRTWSISAIASGSVVSNLTCCVDHVRNRVICAVLDNGTFKLYAYSIAAGTWSVLTSTGDVPTTMPGEPKIIHSPSANKYYMLGNNAWGLRIYDIATGAWTIGASPHANLIQTNGCFYYDDRRRVALLLASISGVSRLYAYKD